MVIVNRKKELSSVEIDRRVLKNWMQRSAIDDEHDVDVTCVT